MASRDIAGLIAAARTEQQAGRWGRAAALLEDALTVAPEHPAVLNALGLCALEMRDPAAAAAWFSRAVAADAKAPPLWMNLAKAKRLLGDDAGEAESLEQALAIDQRHLMALIRRAELHERLGERAQASTRWNGVVALTRGIDVPPELRPIIDHAQQFVAGQARLFEQAIAKPLAQAREGQDPRDLRRFDACMGFSLGKRAIFANHCAGVYFPFLPADEFFDDRFFPWFEQLRGAASLVRAEVLALMDTGAPEFEPYVQQEPGTPENKWSALDQKLNWSALHLWKHGQRQGAACALCPQTAALLDALPLSVLPGRAPNAFLSVLKPRTRIPPHTGVTNTRAIVHLPLVVPEGCGFRVGGETRAWVEGEPFAFDDTIEHEAWNDSDHPRAVLIFDVWNPHLTQLEQTMLKRYFESADASELNPKAAALRT